MSFGRIGTIRALILCGTAAALVFGGSPALARHRHTHHHSKHASAKHETPEESGATTQQGGAKGAAAATVAGAASVGALAGAAGAAGVELVPGPLPLPAQASTETGASSPAPAAAPAAPAKAAREPSAKEQSGEASPAEPPTPVAANITIAPSPSSSTPSSSTPSAPTPVAARSAIDTAVAKLFLGEPVYGASGEPIGDLAQIFPGPDGQVKSVVITWGGLFGYFQSHRTIAWPNAGPSIQGGKLVLQGLTKAALQSTETQ